MPSGHIARSGAGEPPTGTEAMANTLITPPELDDTQRGETSRDRDQHNIYAPASDDDAPKILLETTNERHTSLRASASASSGHQAS